MNNMSDADTDIEFDVLLAQISLDRLDELAVKIRKPLEARMNAAIASSRVLLQSVEILAPPAADHAGMPMYQRLGGIVRVLHDSLRELGYDRSLSRAAAQITDAQDRLEYVAALTEKAANKVLNAIDIGMPEQEELARHARAMGARWALLDGGAAGVEECNSLARESGQFAARVAQAADSETARLLEIMMAQDFQDITGQLIKKIITIIKAVELELAQLLLDNAPAEMQVALAAEASRPEELMQGPALPAVALGQDSVDDLLDSLGF